MQGDAALEYLRGSASVKKKQYINKWQSSLYKITFQSTFIHSSRYTPYIAVRHNYSVRSLIQNNPFKR